jgi:hypothetical protein
MLLKNQAAAGVEAPLAFQADNIRSTIACTFLPFLTSAKMVGPPSRILRASLSITFKSAPTSSARSVLFTINRSDWVIPGPPLRGILSPPETSIYKGQRGTVSSGGGDGPHR